MNKNKLSLIAAVALSAAGLAFSTANAADTATTVDAGKGAQCASGKCDGPGRGGKGGFLKELGITTDQLEKMNTLKLGFESSVAPKKAELMTLSRELRDDITKPGVSKSQLLSLQSKINGIRDDLSTSRISYMADKIAILTPDQQAKIREFSLKHNMGGGRHHGHGFGKRFHGKGGPGGPGGPGGHRFGGDNKAFGPGPDAPPAPPEGV